jgi:ADP-ribosylglycohydrolase
MRVSPVGWAFNSEAEVLAQAKASSEVTHNHPEGIKGAQAVALAIFLARNKNTKETIKKEIAGRFKYDLNRTLAQIRPSYRFDVSCQGSVPEAIIAFLESNCFEDAVRKAVSLGGDSDTIACIAGAIAEAYYQSIPAEIEENTLKRLDPTLQKVVENFVSRFVQRNKKCRLSFED